MVRQVGIYIVLLLLLSSTSYGQLWVQKDRVLAYEQPLGNGDMLTLSGDGTYACKLVAQMDYSRQYAYSFTVYRLYTSDSSSPRFSSHSNIYLPLSHVKPKLITLNYIGNRAVIVQPNSDTSLSILTYELERFTPEPRWKSIAQEIRLNGLEVDMSVVADDIKVCLNFSGDQMTVCIPKDNFDDGQKPTPAVYLYQLQNGVWNNTSSTLSYGNKWLPNGQFATYSNDYTSVSYSTGEGEQTSLITLPIVEPNVLKYENATSTVIESPLFAVAKQSNLLFTIHTSPKTIQITEKSINSTQSNDSNVSQTIVVPEAVDKLYQPKMSADGTRMVLVGSSALDEGYENLVVYTFEKSDQWRLVGHSSKKVWFHSQNRTERPLMLDYKLNPEGSVLFLSYWAHRDKYIHVYTWNPDFVLEIPIEEPIDIPIVQEVDPPKKRKCALRRKKQ